MSSHYAHYSPTHSLTHSRPHTHTSRGAGSEAHEVLQAVLGPNDHEAASGPPRTPPRTPPTWPPTQRQLLRYCYRCVRVRAAHRNDLFNCELVPSRKGVAKRDPASALRVKRREKIGSGPSRSEFTISFGDLYRYILRTTSFGYIGAIAVLAPAARGTHPRCRASGVLRLRR